MKNTSLNKFSFWKTTVVLFTAILCILPILSQQAFALSPLGPLRVQDGTLLDSYGKPFIFRGVTINHTLAPEKTLQALKDIAAAGANSAQIEFPITPDGFPRTVAAQLREIIASCKENKLICVLEPNDAAGYPNYSRYGSDLPSYWLWSDLLSVLYGNQSHIIIGLGNQHFAAGEYPGDYQQRITSYAATLQNGLPSGFVVMIDGDNWSEDTSKAMLDVARSLKDSSSLTSRLIYSVDMFYSYQDPNKVRDYIASFSELGAPLVIGGFGPVPYYHPNRPIPLQLDAPQLPAASVMQYAEQYGAGYFGWSWSGNENSNLDVVTNYDANALTTWGNLLFNGANGIKATAKLASIYATTSSSSSSSSSISSTSSISSVSSVSSNSSSSVQANRPPIANFTAYNYPSIYCGNPNAGEGRITAEAVGSSDPDGDLLTYSWSLNYGGTATGYKATFTSRSGYSYKLTLLVTDSHGASASLTRDVGAFYLDCPFSSSSSPSSSTSSSRSSLSSSSSSYPSSSRSSSSSSSKVSSSSSVSSIGKVQCSYVIQSEWANGFTGAIRLKNIGTQPISAWSVNWQYKDSSKVTNVWNANLSGNNPYTAKNLSWNSIIQPGQTIEFGFQGSKPSGPAKIPPITGPLCQ